MITLEPPYAVRRQGTPLSVLSVSITITQPFSVLALACSPAHSRCAHSHTRDAKVTSLIRDIIPTNYSLLIIGPSGVGKLEYFVDLAKGYLEQGDGVVFVTVEAHTEDICGKFLRSGLDPAPYEGEKLVFIDCFSATAGQEPSSDPRKRTLSVSSLSNLEQIGMNITKAAEWLGPPTRVFFYTLSPLFFHNSTASLAKFFQIVSSQIRTKYGFAAYALHEGVHDDTTVKTLQMFVDGVIEMRFDENLKREMRVHHLKGLETTARWVSFNVSDGFEMESDDRLLERRFTEAEARTANGRGRSVHEP